MQKFNTDGSSVISSGSIIERTIKCLIALKTLIKSKKADYLSKGKSTKMIYQYLSMIFKALPEQSSKLWKMYHKYKPFLKQMTVDPWMREGFSQGVGNA